MTVIVRYENKKPEYRSLSGPGSSEEERSKARELDAILKRRIEKASAEIKKNKAHVSKGDVEIYWHLGFVLRDIYSNSGLVSVAEKFLFYQNAKLHLPDFFLAKDRGVRRNHLEYCFRLGGFSKAKALKLKWGEWVYLFDSPGINSETRFDNWLDVKIGDHPKSFTRENVRLFVQCSNMVFYKIETKDLNDSQLKNCYEAAWQLKEKAIKIGVHSDKQLKEKMKASFLSHRRALGEVMNGAIGPDVFSDEVLKPLSSN